MFLWLNFLQFYLNLCTLCTPSGLSTHCEHIARKLTSKYELHYNLRRLFWGWQKNYKYSQFPVGKNAILKGWKNKQNDNQIIS